MKYSEVLATAAQLFRAREPFLVIGPPGVGKTHALCAAASTAGQHIVLTHPVVQEEVDVRGLPGFQPDKDGKLRAVFVPFGDLRLLTEATAPTVCIVDDASQARLSVQAAYMQLVHAREVDGQKLSPHVTFAFAGNRREDKAAVQGFVSALLDRMVTVLQLDFDAGELASYLLRQGYDPMLAAYIRFAPDKVSFQTVSDFEKSPTARSIEGLGRLLKMQLDSPEIVAGAVGPSFASAFLAYRQVEGDLPDVKLILAEPTAKRYDGKEGVPKSLEVLHALIASLTQAVTAENAEAAITYLERVPPEFAVFGLKDVAQKFGAQAVAKWPAFGRWVEKHGELLGEAGK